MEIVKDIMLSAGIFLMILPIAVVIYTLMALVVGKCLDKYLGVNKE